MPMTEEGKAREAAGLQSGGPNLSLFGADPPLLHSQDSAKNSPTVGTDLQGQEKETQVIQKEGEQQKQDRKVIKKEEVELKKVGSGDDETAIVSKLTPTTTSTTAAISTTPTTRKPLPVNEPKPVLPPSKQLRMVSHSLSLFQTFIDECERESKQ